MTKAPCFKRHIDISRTLVAFEDPFTWKKTNWVTEATNLMNTSTPVTSNFRLIPFQFFLSLKTCLVFNGSRGSVSGGASGVGMVISVSGVGSTFTVVWMQPICKNPQPKKLSIKLARDDNAEISGWDFFFLLQNDCADSDPPGLQKCCFLPAAWLLHLGRDNTLNGRRQLKQIPKFLPWQTAMPRVLFCHYFPCRLN